MEEEKDMTERIASFWCRVAHTKAMWPMHGRYICPQCLREHPVFWEETGASAPVAGGKAKGDYRVSTAVSVTQ